MQGGAEGVLSGSVVRRGGLSVPAAVRCLRSDWIHLLRARTTRRAARRLRQAEPR